MANDFYQTLGVGENASSDEIKSAFRTLAKKFHPDRNQGDKSAESRFKEISEAYDTLSDTKKKAEYDTMRKYGAFAGGGRPGGPGGMGGFQSGDFSQFFHQGGGGQGGFQTFGGRGMSGFDGLEDILASFFGGRGAGGFSASFGSRGGPQAGPRMQRQGPQTGNDAHATVRVSFWDMVEGTTKKIRHKTTGKLIKFRIPAGIKSGSKIRLAGQGNPGWMGSPDGDLIITVKVMADQNFERKGNDVYTNVTVPFTVAILGGKVAVKTLAKTVSLTVAPGTQPGTKLRLKGLGLAVGDTHGDLYVTVNVTIPTSITAHQRELLEKWEG
ncbi:MAG: DnaJ C-terminal domain-containing protein [bacterium]